jgi:hypothetical protein
VQKFICEEVFVDHRALLCTVTFRILAVDRVEPPLIVGGIADFLPDGPYLPHECSGKWGIPLL